ncbi:hypothetical protein PROFUN_10014 [Planoprotostelium fungivorum]|uniref:Uncharacterized protein n=1 Tax=Planoprotostelium fungivorum TaxID=1890364 RepID=A0A2P6NFQ8_9EUKA|nr:hypothetical protein PROFUN_10014 [Planoprotostelium fungivorum]
MKTYTAETSIGGRDATNIVNCDDLLVDLERKAKDPRASTWPTVSFCLGSTEA